MNKIPIYHIYLYIRMCANVYVYMKLSKIYFFKVDTTKNATWSLET